MKSIKTVILAILLAAFLLPPATNAALLDIPDVPRDKVICFVLYTVHNNILKLTAQLYPLRDSEDRNVQLQIRQNGKWTTIATANVTEDGWAAMLRVENWDSSRNIEYRVTHEQNAYYTGIIRKDPIDKDTIVVAAFTGNSIYPRHGGDIPKTDIIENIKMIDPDLLFFSGDQVYNHHKHYAYWLRFGRDFGELTRSIPTVTIPDDHDVGHSNLWGAAGKKSNTRKGHDGGYAAPVEYVNMVQRAQTSHLPDPYDSTPIQRGIGVYYTSLNIGRVSFAIIEDRKFKSGPQGLVNHQGPRPDHITDPNYDPESLDVPGAKLLGDRQLQFLRNWAANWKACDIKCVLSQTIFAGGAHLHGQRNNRIAADLDSNGWPQTGRKKALAEIRKAFAFMIAGDQHLATIIHHGIDNHNDAGYSFCVPSIANLYLRWWAPLTPGRNREKNMPEYTGEFLDGFNNKVTVLAVANPSEEENHDKLTTRAAGFGVVRFNTKTRDITIECWPRNIDIADPAAKQYPGWPRTIKQQDNYDRKATAFLPTIEVSGMKNPVVQIIDESNNKIVYTIRIKGNSYKPKVFKKGIYTIKVGGHGSGEIKTFTTVSPLHPGQTKTIKVNDKNLP